MDGLRSTGASRGLNWAAAKRRAGLVVAGRDGR
jgi:hypothetical protein